MAVASLIGPSSIHTDNIGLVDGLRRGEQGCCGPTQEDADLRINNRKVLTECAEKGRDLEVKHAKAHRAGKGKTAMTKEQTMVMEGNENTEQY